MRGKDVQKLPSTVVEVAAQDGLYTLETNTICIDGNVVLVMLMHSFPGFELRVNRAIFPFIHVWYPLFFKCATLQLYSSTIPVKMPTIIDVTPLVDPVSTRFTCCSCQYACKSNL